MDAPVIQNNYNGDPAWQTNFRLDGLLDINQKAAGAFSPVGSIFKSTGAIKNVFKMYILEGAAIYFVKYIDGAEVRYPEGGIDINTLFGR